MVKKQKSITKNVIMNIILTMSSFIFPLITFPYISRILSPTGTGKVSFATAFISYFNMFAQLGIPTYGIRACAKVRDDKDELSKVANELLIINFFMGMISYLILFFVINNVQRFQQDKNLYLIISLTLFFNIIGMEWLYKALEQYTYITTRSIIFKIIAILAMFCIIHKESDYILYGGISIFAASASNILNFFNVQKYISKKNIKDLNISRHFKPIFIFFAMSCATTIYTNLDTIMLGFITTDTEVGYYNAAIKIKIILVNIVTALGAVLLPRSSYYIEHNMMTEFKKVNTKAFNSIFLLSIPLLTYFILFAQPCIYFISGSAYTKSIVPMRIIMPTLLIIGISYQIGIQVLVPMGLEKIVLCSEITGAFTDMILNFTLIPLFGASGAAFGTLVAEVVVLLIQLSFLKNKSFDFFKGIRIDKLLIATTMGIFLSIWIIFLKINSFTQLLLSSVIFFGIYGIFLILAKEPAMLEIWKQISQVYNHSKKI